MIAALRKTRQPDRPRCIVLTATDVQEKQLCDFVSQVSTHQNSVRCSRHPPHDFLINDPCTWENNEACIKAQKDAEWVEGGEQCSGAWCGTDTVIQQCHHQPGTEAVPVAGNREASPDLP